MENKRSKRSIIIVTILCLFIVVVNIVNLTFAYLTDSEVGDDTFVTFGTIDIDAKFKSGSTTSDKFTFDSSSVMAGEQINRTVTIQNLDVSDKCVVRMYLKFYLTINGSMQDVTDQEYLKLTIGTTGASNWTADNAQEPKYYYYNSALATNASTDVDLVMTIQSNFGVDTLTGNLTTTKYKISLYVEALQFANSAYETVWEGEMPAGWNPAA